LKTLNKIEAILDKSDYEIYDDFMNFRIDDFWFDEKLDELIPKKKYKGLIPTLNACLYLNNEIEVVSNRILPKLNETLICPILMCPDDCDFSCTLIVAEIVNNGNIIQWKRVGLDQSENWEAEKVGSEVDWFNNLPVMNFKYSEYLTMLDNFKIQLEIDRIKWEKIEQEKELSEKVNKKPSFLKVCTIKIESVMKILK
jgi:hypothetical protein